MRLAMILMCVHFMSVNANSQVLIGDGEVLAYPDLLAGSFMGQSFVLGSNTEFVIEAGGGVSALPVLDFEPFDMYGSKIVFQGGSGFFVGASDEGSFVSNVEIELLDGAVVSGKSSLRLTGDSRLRLIGGQLDVGFAAFGTDIDFVSGVATGAAIDNNSSLLMTGGEFLQAISFRGQNPVGYINGGLIHGSATLKGTASVFLIAGMFGSESELKENAQLLWSGGAIGRSLHINDQAQLRIVGGQYELNNKQINEVTRDLEDGDIITGVLLDGMPFVLTPINGDIIPASSLIFDKASIPPANPAPIVLVNQIGPRGYRGVDEVQVLGGGIVPAHSTAIDTEFVVDGGSIENGFECVRSTIEVIAGDLGWEITLLDHSSLTVYSGTVSSWMRVSNGSRLDFYDATMLSSLRVLSGGAVNQFAGSMGSNIQIEGGGVFNVFGGVRGTGLVVVDGGQLNLYVQDATLDGSPLGLLPGESMTIMDRGGAVLEGHLENGDSFRHELHGGFSFSDIFLPGSVVTVTLSVPCEADLTVDGALDFFDVSAFIVAYQAQDPDADFNNDGDFNFFDVSAFLVAFQAGCP